MHLEGTYTVRCDGQPVGKVEVKRQGLYWLINCRCQPANDRMLHLQMEMGKSSADLGLLIPVSGMLELRKQIPIKRIAQGSPVFWLRDRKTSSYHFQPIDPDIPFPWLERIGECVFTQVDSKKGVKLRLENKGEKEKNNA